jgi:hypothetical protein
MKLFCSGVAGGALVAKSHASLSLENLNKLNKLAIQSVIKGLHQWHCTTYFPWDRELSLQENEFINACISSMDDWQCHVEGDFWYSNFSYSHRNKKGNLNHGRMFYGNVSHPEKIAVHAKRVLQYRDISLNTSGNLKDRIVALGWDMESDHFKIYALYSSPEEIFDSEIRALAETHREWYLGNPIVAGYTYKNNKLVEKKAYLALPASAAKELAPESIREDVIFGNAMISSSRGLVPQLDVKGAALSENLLTKDGKSIITSYEKKWGLTLDTLSLDDTGWTLYFPS